MEAFRTLPTTAKRCLAGILAIAVFVVLLRPSKSSESPHGDSGHDKSGTRHAFRQRLVAVGDLHGDILNAHKVLQMAAITSKEAPDKWAAGQDILVQTGDMVDRGTYMIDLYRLFQSLRGQAEGQGGQVVSILGNHEMMNAIGDYRYVTKADIATFGGLKQRQQAISVNGWLGQEWLANYSITAAVPLSPSSSSPLLSFTHGSLSPSFPHLLPYPDRINSMGSTLLERALTPPLPKPHPPNPYQGLPKGSTQEEHDLYGSEGPLWNRGLAAEENDALVCKWAAELKEKLGVRRIIGGHTPTFDRIVDRCDSSVIIIDTGISYVYGGVPSALEILYTLDAVDDSRHEDPLMAMIDRFELVKGRTYKETEVVTAIYEDRREILHVETGETVW